MKIIYSAGNRVGAGMQLNRIVSGLNYHIIKTAAHYKSSSCSRFIDWNLDALSNKYIRTNKRITRELGLTGNYDSEILKTLVLEVNEFAPDLIICDYEPIMAQIAQTMGIKLWYCSPIHIISGVKRHEYGTFKFRGVIDKSVKALDSLPKPDKTLIYSPYGDFCNIPLKDEYEWCQPYHIDINSKNKEFGVMVVLDTERISELSKLFNCVPPFCFTMFGHAKYNMSHLTSLYVSEEEKYRMILENCRWLLCDGATDIIADALYGGINNICVSPDLTDPEGIINSSFVERYNFGNYVGQIELLGKYAVEEITKSFETPKINSQKINNSQTLNRIIELCI